ncbi:hypothetical protein BJ956_000259 [Arthrobacter psychrochitiniphilus]|nr:hypothetical protein [Arthrobacter psychrochitiniphilus]
MGADVHLDAAGFDIGIRSSWEQAIKDVEDARASPIPSRQAPPNITWAGWALLTGPMKWSSRRRN